MTRLGYLRMVEKQASHRRGYMQAMTEVISLLDTFDKVMVDKTELYKILTEKRPT